MAATKVILEVRRRLGVARRRPAGSQRGVEAVRQHLAARTRRPHGVVRRHRKKAAVGSNMVAAHRRLVKAPTALRLLTHTAQRRHPAAKAPTALRLPTRMAHRRRMIRTALRPVAPTVPRRLATAHHPAARRTVPHLAATLAPPTALPAADTMALPAATARRPRRTTSRTSLSAQPPPATTSQHHQPQPARSHPWRGVLRPPRAPLLSPPRLLRSWGLDAMKAMGLDEESRAEAKRKADAEKAAAAAAQAEKLRNEVASRCTVHALAT